MAEEWGIEEKKSMDVLERSNEVHKLIFKHRVLSLMKRIYMTWNLLPVLMISMIRKLLLTINECLCLTFDFAIGSFTLEKKELKWQSRCN